MHLVDDIHLAFALRRQKFDLVADLSDLIDAAVGRRVDLQDIHELIVIDGRAVGAYIAGLDVYKRQPLLKPLSVC